ERLDDELMLSCPEVQAELRAKELERQVGQLKQEIEDWKTLLEIEIDEASVLTRMLFNENVGELRCEMGSSLEKYDHTYVSRELLLNTKEGKKATEEMEKYWEGSTWRQLTLRLPDGTETFIYVRQKRQAEAEPSVELTTEAAV
ncbi:MAG: hypothetical protein ABFD98_17970, partial [Syntrophobacteraceae bacterium]|nr:hypothetical protein [Desulfobacteraceae bacterium]